MVGVSRAQDDIASSMFQIIGIVLLFGLVFGSYLISGGKLEVIMHALPHEMMAIGGAGPRRLPDLEQHHHDEGHPGRSRQGFAGPKWKKQDYKDLLSLLFQLTKTMKSKGVIALESHIEKAGREHHLPEISQGAEGPFRHGLHLRHPAHDDHEPGGSSPDRGRHGKAAREAPPRGARGAPRPDGPRRRPARPGHRRGRAGGHQDHGLDHRAAGNAGRHDRRRPWSAPSWACSWPMAWSAPSPRG
jgi:hypothetical protein